MSYRFADSDQTQLRRLADGAIVPCVEGNSDYADFLRWQTAGNAALPYETQPPRVPDQVTLYQGRAALIGAGLFDQVKAAVEGLGQSSLAYQAFEYANHWYRDSPFIAQLAGVLKLTESQIDELFFAAAAQ